MTTDRYWAVTFLPWNTKSLRNCRLIGNVGFGYRVVCSCHQLIEVWPEHYLTKEVAESLAREQWVEHSRELSPGPKV